MPSTLSSYPPGSEAYKALLWTAKKQPMAQGGLLTETIVYRNSISVSASGLRQSNENHSWPIKTFNYDAMTFPDRLDSWDVFDQVARKGESRSITGLKIDQVLVTADEDGDLVPISPSPADAFLWRRYFDDRRIILKVESTGEEYLYEIETAEATKLSTKTAVALSPGQRATIMPAVEVDPFGAKLKHETKSDTTMSLEEFESINPYMLPGMDEKGFPVEVPLLDNLPILDIRPDEDDSLSTDFDSPTRIYRQGWASRPAPERLGGSEATMSFSTVLPTRKEWARLYGFYCRQRGNSRAFIAAGLSRIQHLSVSGTTLITKGLGNPTLWERRSPYVAVQYADRSRSWHKITANSDDGTTANLTLDSAIEDKPVVLVLPAAIYVFSGQLSLTWYSAETSVAKITLTQTTKPTFKELEEYIFPEVAPSYSTFDPYACRFLDIPDCAPPNQSCFGCCYSATEVFYFTISKRLEYQSCPTVENEVEGFAVKVDCGRWESEDGQHQFVLAVVGGSLRWTLTSTIDFPSPPPNSFECGACAGFEDSVHLIQSDCKNHYQYDQEGCPSSRTIFEWTVAIYEPE